MNERDQVEVNATLDALRPIALELRRRGYDATLWVERRDDHYTVEVRLRVPPLGTPIEAELEAVGS
jgi:hypothetical protein